MATSNDKNSKSFDSGSDFDDIPLSNRRAFKRARISNEMSPNSSMDRSSSRKKVKIDCIEVGKSWEGSKLIDLLRTEFPQKEIMKSEDSDIDLLIRSDFRDIACCIYTMDKWSRDIDFSKYGKYAVNFVIISRFERCEIEGKTPEMRSPPIDVDDIQLQCVLKYDITGMVAKDIGEMLNIIRNLSKKAQKKSKRSIVQNTNKLLMETVRTIPGVSESIAVALLKHFGSIRKLSTASAGTLQSVMKNAGSRISQKSCQKIIDFFHKK